MVVRDLILTVFVFGMLPVVVFAPHFGIYLWYWIGYMSPHRLTWGFAYDLPFAQVVAVATLAGTLFTRDKKKVPWNSTTILLVAFTFWVSLSTYFAMNEAAAVKQYQQFLKIQLMTFVTMMVINDPKKLRGLLWVMVAAVGIYGIKGGVFTILTGGEHRVWGPPAGMLSGNNELGLALVVVLPLMRYLQLTATQAWVRMALIGSMVLCGFAILGTHSRGSFLAGSVMVMALAAKTRRRWLVIPLIALLAIGVFSFAPESWFDRMGTIKDYDQDASAMGRINAWYFAYNLARDRPFVGGGFDVFIPEIFLEYAPVPEDFHDSHSIYFGVLGEHGFVGLGLFLAIGLATFLRGRSIRKAIGDREDLAWAGELAAMTQVSLLGYVVNGAFLGLAYFEMAYNLLAIMVITETLSKQALADDLPAGEAALAVGRSVPRGVDVTAESH